MTVKPFHPLANILPLIQGAQFDWLVADIGEHGLLNAITLYEDQILEGRNRALACRAAGIEPLYVEYEGKDPAGFVISQNLARRHLGPSERAMVAARMAKLKWGQRSDRVWSAPRGVDGRDAFQLAICRACSSSNLTGLVYPSAEWRRLAL
jgi:hypothetical protein